MTTRNRGFASLTPEQRANVSSLGGRAGADNPNRPWAKNPELAKEMARRAVAARMRNKLTRTTDTVE